MKIIRLIGIIALLSLYPAFCQAERQLWARHNFSVLNAEGNLAFLNSNTVGKTDVLTYTCSGGGTFAFTSTYVISLPNNGSEVVISPAISKLAGIYITYSSPSSQCENVKVYVSTDGTSWGEPIPNADIVCTPTTIDVTLNRRNYYIKIVHTKKADFYIGSIDYYTEDCNCFPYIPE